MKYRFQPSLTVDHNILKKFLAKGEEVTKLEILERCAGRIEIVLLQYLKELEFDRIGKDQQDELYLS